MICCEIAATNAPKPSITALIVAIADASFFNAGYLAKSMALAELIKLFGPPIKNPIKNIKK